MKSQIELICYELCYMSRPLISEHNLLVCCLNKMADHLQTAFSNAASWNKIGIWIEIWLGFALKDRLTAIQLWFRYWLATNRQQAITLSNDNPVRCHIYASPCLSGSYHEYESHWWVTFITNRKKISGSMNIKINNQYHYDVIKWKHFPRYWTFVRGIHQSQLDSPHKRPITRAFGFPLLIVWTDGWTNTRLTDDSRHHVGNLTSR